MTDIVTIVRMCLTFSLSIFFLNYRSNDDGSIMKTTIMAMTYMTLLTIMTAMMAMKMMMMMTKMTMTTMTATAV